MYSWKKNQAPILSKPGVILHIHHLPVVEACCFSLGAASDQVKGRSQAETSWKMNSPSSSWGPSSELARAGCVQGAPLPCTSALKVAGKRKTELESCTGVRFWAAAPTTRLGGELSPPAGRFQHPWHCTHNAELDELGMLHALPLQHAWDPLTHCSYCKALPGVWQLERNKRRIIQQGSSPLLPPPVGKIWLFSFFFPWRRNPGQPLTPNPRWPIHNGCSD